MSVVIVVEAKFILMVQKVLIHFILLLQVAEVPVLYCACTGSVTAQVW